ncbi:MAG: DTW domain-containing protein [Polyangiaceae bacterium]|nr:DTW domain-containing protein [Polyangiaceae bacterium]
MTSVVPTPFEPRAICWRCTRPARVCWCRFVPRIDAKNRVLLLQHPREEFMPIGTARMAAACLPRASLIVGTELDDAPEVRSILDDEAEPPILLWPGPGALDLERHPPKGPVTLVVVDGTWSTAKKLVRINPRIASLPRYSLSPDEPSQYQIRAEPRAECVSTLEAVMYALGILEGDKEKFRPMLSPFLSMIDMQLDHERQSPGPRRVRRPRPPKPRFVPSALREGRPIVVVAGEANAWPRKPGSGRRNGIDAPYPDELIQWLAIRVDDGTTFDAIAAPRQPLSPVTRTYTTLGEDEIRGGMSFGELAERWRAFVRDDDVVCGWGPYAASLLRSEGGFLPRTFVDLRGSITQWLGDKPGTIESFSERFGVEPRSIGRGRGGRRLAMAFAATKLLLGA